MPSRILKESICTSESLAYLSAEAEVLFYRLTVKADDFGLYYGSPKILASLLFPLNVPTEKKVSSWLAELVNGGLVATYRAEDGRQYLKLLSWDKHQNRRATKPKYPLPQEFDNTCSQGVSSDNSDTCAQMQADSSVNVNENVFPSGSGYSRRRLPSVPVGHIPEPGRRPGNDPSLGLPVQNSRLRLGEAKPEIAFLVLGPGELDTRKRGNLPSGHKRQTEARVSVSP